MKIGIIGAGNIGGTLTRRFRTLGHEVFVANSRGPETLKERRRKRAQKPLRRKRRREQATWSL